MRVFLTIAAVLALSACEAVRDEIGYPGGAPERVANERLFAAWGREQRTDRYLMSLTILTSLAGDLADSPAQAKAAATLIKSSFNTLDKMRDAVRAGCASTTTKVPVDTCNAPDGNSEFAFESHTYEMQSKLYSLSKIILNSSDFDGLADDIIDLNLLGIVSSARRAFPILRRSFATYRDTIVTFGDAIAYSGSCSANSANVENRCGDLRRALTQLKTGEISGSLNEDEVRVISRLVDEIETLTENANDGGNTTWRLNARHRDGLTYHVNRACARLEAIQSIQGEDLVKESCQRPIANAT